LMCSVLVGCSAGPERPRAAGERLTVGLVEFVSDPAFLDARKGFMDALQAGQPQAGTPIKVELADAKGDSLALKPILMTLDQEHVDLIVTFGSPTLEGAINLIDVTPVVFGVAINPLILGLDKEHRQGHPNITGTYAEPPMHSLGTCMQSILPHMGVVGTIWNPTEINSRYEMLALRRMCKENGYELVESRVRGLVTIEHAAGVLLDADIDALVVMADNTVVAGFDVVAPLFKKKGIPIFTDMPSLVRPGGADLGWGFDFYEWGRTTGGLALRVLTGSRPLDVPISEFQALRIVINQQAFTALNLTVPPELLEKAELISG
jgi:putative ABC transport system substrate-binding protein